MLIVDMVTKYRHAEWRDAEFFIESVVVLNIVMLCSFGKYSSAQNKYITNAKIGVVMLSILILLQYPKFCYAQ
jgi:hypothetical protein